MRKFIYFDIFDQQGWPEPSKLQHYFLTEGGRRQFFAASNDCWGLRVEGSDGTENLELNAGRVDVHLTILGHPSAGVLLNYRRWGGDLEDTFYSKGDLSQLTRLIKSVHGDRWPAGLYIPFETAWKAVRQFIETGGELPDSIDWVDAQDLPDGTFPDPGAP